MQLLYPQLVGWQIIEYVFDATSVSEVGSIDVPLDQATEANNDPMVASLNGLLDLSGQYNAGGGPPPIESGAATHHRFFSYDLDAQGQRVLDDTPHVSGSSMIFVDGIYYLITADAFDGDLVVIE